MRRKFLIPSLVAAGFLPASSVAVPIVPHEDNSNNNLSLFDVFKLDQKYNLAAHRSHSSHGSHRSSTGGSIYTPRKPAPLYIPPAPRYNPTPPQQILPNIPAAPKTLPGNSSKFKAAVIEVQTCLMSYGFYQGVIDGIVGPETAVAISKLQEQWGLPITGTLTPKVLDACRISIY